MNDFHKKNSERVVTSDDGMTSCLQTMASTLKTYCDRLERGESTMSSWVGYMQTVVSKVSERQEIASDLAIRDRQIEHLQAQLTKAITKKEKYKKELRAQYDTGMSPPKPPPTSGNATALPSSAIAADASALCYDKPGSRKSPPKSMHVATTKAGRDTGGGDVPRTPSPGPAPTAYGALEKLVVAPELMWPVINNLPEDYSLSPTTYEENKKRESAGEPSSLRPVTKLQLLTPTPEVGKKTNKGYTVSSEIFRLYRAGVFNPKDGTVVDKTMLFNEKHPNFIRPPLEYKDKKKYTDGMMFVACGITGPDFAKLIGDTLCDNDLRALAEKIADDTMKQVAELEVQFQLRKGSKRSKSTDSLNSLGSRFVKLREAMVKQYGNETDVENKLASLSGLTALSPGTKRQSSISQWQRKTKMAKTASIETRAREEE